MMIEDHPILTIGVLWACVILHRSAVGGWLLLVVTRTSGLLAAAPVGGCVLFCGLLEHSPSHTQAGYISRSGFQIVSRNCSKDFQQFWEIQYLRVATGGCVVAVRGPLTT